MSSPRDPEEDEAFALKKKRFELVIEEKEWMLRSSAGEDKMTSIVEYVNAVEAYKELCSSQVPDTVSDLLSRYVKVFVVHPTAKGYDEAFDFLCMSDEGPTTTTRRRREAADFLAAAATPRSTSTRWIRSSARSRWTTTTATTRTRMISRMRRGVCFVASRRRVPRRCIARKTWRADGVGSRTTSGARSSANPTAISS